MKYSNTFLNRNIGLISLKEQNQLQKSKVLICGVGGMGGVCAEALVRMGVGEISLVDHDSFDLFNINRQIHSNTKTIGMKKVSILKKEFLKINPALKISIYKDKLSRENVEEILKNVDVVVNGMDDMKSSLILERTARLKKITIVDAWITPFASVFVIDKNAPHWEEFLKLPSLGIKEEELTESILKECLRKELNYTLSHFDPFSYISKNKVNKIISGEIKRPSFLPVVWMSGILMANEVFKVLTKRNHSGFEGFFFNQYKNKIKKGKISKKNLTK